jgi:tetratricopeptide (TPR) repeat protein
MPKGGDLGTERYRARIAHLVKTKPAYEAYDKGRAALAKNDLASASQLANQAINLEPREGHFHALLGDTEQKNKRPKAALMHYDKAISLNPNFFYHFLQRGIIEEQLNLDVQAQADLERSLTLLPTGDAYYTLGHLARKSGRLNDAKAYYAKVAGGEGQLGQQAYGSLVDLDLKDNPANYIEVRTGQDAQGRILARISNPTPRNIGGLVLLIQFKNSAGNIQQIKRTLEGTISAGSQQLFDLGLSGQLTKNQIASLQATIVDAEVIH